MNLSSIVHALARWLAILGGLFLVAITVMTVVSIVGRAFISVGLGPVPGDFELVEAGIGFAVFAFLPWCQLNRGHADVDLFTSYLSPAVNRVLNLLLEIVLGLVTILIAWRLWVGMLEKREYGEITFILEFRYIPVVSGAITSEDVEKMADALDEMEGPIFAYCRSGARSTNLYMMAKQLRG